MPCSTIGLGEPVDLSSITYSIAVPDERVDVHGLLYSRCAPASFFFLHFAPEAGEIDFLFLDLSVFFPKLNALLDPRGVRIVLHQHP